MQGLHDLFYAVFNGATTKLAARGAIVSDVSFLQSLFTSTTEDDAQDALGGTTVGKGVFTAASTAAAATALDIGQWTAFTPTLTFATPGDLSVAYTTRVGRRMVVGNSCTVMYSIVTSSFTHTTASGGLQITGLPFTSANVTGAAPTGQVIWEGITKASYTSIAARIDPNTALIAFSASGSAQSAVSVAAGDVPTGGTVVLQGTITYEI